MFTNIFFDIYFYGKNSCFCTHIFFLYSNRVAIYAKDYTILFLIIPLFHLIQKVKHGPRRGGGTTYPVAQPTPVSPTHNFINIHFFIAFEES